MPKFSGKERRKRAKGGSYGNNDCLSSGAFVSGRDINSDLPKTAELYCRDLPNYRRHSRLNPLALPWVVDRDVHFFPVHTEERRCGVKGPTIHQPLLSLIAGILILIMPGLLNLIVAIYLIVSGLLGIIRGQSRLSSIFKR